MLFEFFFVCFILVSIMTMTEMSCFIFVTNDLSSVLFIAWNLSLLFYRYFLQQVAITQPFTTATSAPTPRHHHAHTNRPNSLAHIFTQHNKKAAQTALLCGLQIYSIFCNLLHSITDKPINILRAGSGSKATLAVSGEGICGLHACRRHGNDRHTVDSLDGKVYTALCKGRSVD